MGIMLGGDKCWLARSHGDISSFYHWINGEPAMVLGRQYLGKRTAYALRMEDAHKCVDSKTGGPSKQMIVAATRAAEVLGFGPMDRFAITKILDIICDGLPDLLRMPPEPTGMTKAQTQAVGEMSIKVAGRTVAEREITALDAQELASVQ